MITDNRPEATIGTHDHEHLIGYAAQWTMR